MFPFAWFVVGAMSTFLIVLGVVTLVSRER
jgi:hypothetical protein